MNRVSLSEYWSCLFAQCISRIDITKLTDAVDTPCRANHVQKEAFCQCWKLHEHIVVGDETKSFHKLRTQFHPRSRETSCFPSVFPLGFLTEEAVTLCLCVGLGKIPASLSSKRAGEQSSAGAFLHKQRPISWGGQGRKNERGGTMAWPHRLPLVIHQSVHQTMMAILAGARLLAAQICPMRVSVRKEAADGRIHCEEAGALEWYYGSGLACSYSPPIKRAVLRRPLYNPKLWKKKNRTEQMLEWSRNTKNTNRQTLNFDDIKLKFTN